MKKILIILGLVISCVYLSCKKYHDLKENDLMKNPSYIQGRLFLTDTLTQSAVNVPLGGKKVTISLKDSPDLLNYIYSSTTDAEGYFSFENLSADLNYRVSYSETVGGKLYAVDTNGVAAPNGKLVLVAKLKKAGQKGIVFTVTDSLGKRLPGVDVCLFTSPITAGTKTCDGSNYSAKTDANGHAPIFGLNAGSYYSLSKLSIDGILYFFKGITVVRDEVEEVSVIIKPEPAKQTNGLKFTMTDAYNSTISGGKICLFTSKVLFARDTCEASNYSLQTDPTGKVSVMNIPEGKYYIFAEVALKDFKLLLRDSVVLGSTPVERKLIMK